MNQADIQASTLLAESELLELSQSIRKIGHLDTLNGWIAQVIRNEPKLARHLHFPSDPDCKSALLTLVERPSPLSTPIVHLLAERITIFVSHLRELNSHIMRGPTLEPLLENIEQMEKLFRSYRNRFARPKTISSVFEAINSRRLHLYKERRDEPDLRVALRAFYEDADRMDRAAIVGILEFVLSLLANESGGHLSQPRHVWWALLTMFKEGDEAWLHDNRKKLSAIIRHWISLEHYAPRDDKGFTTVTPELDSITNERAWVTINAMRLIVREIETTFSSQLIKRIHTLIQTNLSIILSEPLEESLKHLSSRQILLYDAAVYFNRRRAFQLASRRALHLHPNRIGKYFYEDSVASKFAEISKLAEGLVINPKSWIKRTLSSLLISGSAGQGKSEFAVQLAHEFSHVAKRHKIGFSQILYSIGTEVKSQDDLSKVLVELSRLPGERGVRVVIFDEFDKANFDFFTPFLPFLEDGTVNRSMITFFLFAQSTYPTCAIFKSVAEKSTQKATRDFLTRLQLGAVDLPDIRISPEQRLTTVLGMAKNDQPKLRRISKGCLLYFSCKDSFSSNRDLMSDYVDATYFPEEDSICLKSEALTRSNSPNSRSIKNSDWILLEM